MSSVDDILENLAPALRARLAAVRAAAETARLSPDERRVLDALGGEVRHVDEVVVRAGLDAGIALETLLALELRGLVLQRAGSRFARPSDYGRGAVA